MQTTALYDTYQYDGRLNARGTALLLIDMIADLEFPGGERLLGPARRVARRIAAIKERFKPAGVPVIYINELDARWRPNFAEHVQRCLAPGVRGRPIAEMLRPEKDDLCLAASQSSPGLPARAGQWFDKLRLRTLVVTGMAGSVQMRLSADEQTLWGYRMVVPEDCLASRDEAGTAGVLLRLRQLFDAEVIPSTRLTFDGGAPLPTCSPRPSPLSSPPPPAAVRGA